MAPLKTSNFERQVVHAIKRLQDIQGSTSKEISNYLSQEYDVPSEEIKHQVRMALRRGVDYGILQCHKGGVYTWNPDFLSNNIISARRDNDHECTAAYQKLRAWRRSRGRRGRSRSGRRKSGTRSRGRRGGRARRGSGGKKRRRGRARRRSRSRR